jgi:hypothetical protein
MELGAQPVLAYEGLIRASDLYRLLAFPTPDLFFSLADAYQMCEMRSECGEKLGNRQPRVWTL